MRYFVYYYLYDPRLRSVPGGPMKIFDLCNNLVKLGHEVVLFAPDIGSPRSQTAAKVVAIPAFGVPVLGILWHEAASLAVSLLYLAWGRCDAVYVRITTSFVPLLIARLAAARLFTDVNDDPFYRYDSERGPGRLKLPCVRTCDALNLKNSYRVFVVNSAVAEKLRLRLGLAAEKLEVMLSGANTDVFRPLARDGACAELGLDPSLRYLCFVGSLNHWNDYSLLAAVVRRVTAALPGVRCLVVGDVSEEQLRLVSGSPFILAGRVPPAAAAKYISCSEVCLAPLIPQWREIRSVKIFDYLACGRPVAATKAPDADNVFSDCPAVAITPSGDEDAFFRSVMRLLSDPAGAAALGAAGRELVVRKHDRAAAARRLAELTGGRK
ncbi:MAG: glycosyltransferase [Elusimicrobia bacterium]|nr:glycosyltransferase [Elusimicrobiota bacterium]